MLATHWLVLSQSILMWFQCVTLMAYHVEITRYAGPVRVILTATLHRMTLRMTFALTDLLAMNRWAFLSTSLLNIDCLKVGVVVHFGKLHSRSFELLKPVVLRNVRQLDWPDWIRHIIGSLLQHITRQIQTQGLEQASFPVFCSSANWQELCSIYPTPEFKS